MSSLKDIQQHFAAAMASSVMDTTLQHLSSTIEDRPGLTVDERLSIYRRHTVGACVQALMQVYPVCLEVLGERCFRTLAGDYLAQHPSHCADLNGYGENFYQTLADVIARPGFEGMDYLPDLAKLEWHWHALFYRRNDPPFDPAVFAAGLAGDSRTLRLQASHCLCLLESAYPVFTLWQRSCAGQLVSSLEKKPENIVLWRVGNRSQAAAVDRALFDLLRAIVAGNTLAEMTAVGLAVERLGVLVEQGWVIGLRSFPDRLSVTPI